MTTKDEIYDKLCRVLTNYEEWQHDINTDLFADSEKIYDYTRDMYDMLVEIQNNWEEITAQE